MSTAQALAGLELFHSRPIAPTRRLVVGQAELPTEPAPGAGGVLLGGIAARYAPDLYEEDLDDVELLMRQLAAGMRVVQPRVSHRLQADRVGLLRSLIFLEQRVDGPAFEFAHQGSPLVYVLGAVYAADRLETAGRVAAFDAIRRGLKWQGPIGGSLIAYLTGRSDVAAWLAAGVDPVSWALGVLGFKAEGPRPKDADIRRGFRRALRHAHPDHGGAEGQAAGRIAELAEARRILLGA
ncbi:MAG: hypothetical protein GEV08_05175 [Acidimicrobiia bacterium]|nr:hypothetical protein [Acidimicrobiia bacterium]